MEPAIPLDVDVAGIELDSTKFAAKIFAFTERNETLPDGSLKIKILSVAATLAAVGNSDALIPVFAMII
jgi:hypothetical protein